MKKTIALLMAVIIMAAVLAACSGSGAADESAPAEEVTAAAESAAEEEAAGAADKDAGGADVLPDGMYLVDVDTGSSMFHINETMDGKGLLTVSGGDMSVHVILASKKIVNLFIGTAKDAEKEGAELLEPVSEEVTYDDGMTEEAYAFDIPVPQIDEPFTVSIIGTKGNWYEHSVTVSNPEPADED